MPWCPSAYWIIVLFLQAACDINRDLERLYYFLWDQPFSASPLSSRLTTTPLRWHGIEQPLLWLRLRYWPSPSPSCPVPFLLFQLSYNSSLYTIFTSTTYRKQVCLLWSTLRVFLLFFVVVPLFTINLIRLSPLEFLGLASTGPSFWVANNNIYHLWITFWYFATDWQSSAGIRHPHNPGPRTNWWYTLLLLSVGWLHGESLHGSTIASFPNSRRRIGEVWRGGIIQHCSAHRSTTSPYHTPLRYKLQLLLVPIQIIQSSFPSESSPCIEHHHEFLLLIQPPTISRLHPMIEAAISICPRSLLRTSPSQTSPSDLDYKLLRKT